jgi:3'-phosphoadenosine 5'-phosphosulfate sulfotransferase (PAPS reductase)/FAD synthetase
MGYRSIGCEPCTAIPQVGADPRSGRWGGAKLECGIHTASKQSDAEADASNRAAPEPAALKRAN